MTTLTNKPVIIIGTGGHARVLADGLNLINRSILGFTDHNPKFKSWNGIPVIGTDKTIESYDKNKIELINGVGSLPFDDKRIKIYKKFKELGYSFATFIHPTAYVAKDCHISEGCQILAKACIQPGSIIKENVIINTGAQIDHDCSILDHCHLAPNATLCGTVTLAQGVHVGSNATITQEIDIGADSIIGAGSTITENIDEYMVVRPAKCSTEKRRG